MKLFVYGTLKYPEIIRALCNINPEYVEVKISNYKVVALKNKPYPGLITSSGSTAIGKLIDIDDNSYSIISKWEDIEYSPSEITVFVNNNEIKALAFLHTIESEQLSTDWDEESFKKKYLETYVKHRIPNYLETTTLK